MNIKVRESKAAKEPHIDVLLPQPPPFKTALVVKGEKYINERSREGLASMLFRSMEFSIGLFWGGFALVAVGAEGRKALWKYASNTIKPLTALN